MKKIITLVLLLSACTNKQETFKPMVESIKQNYISELGDVAGIDTVNLMLDTVTPKTKIQLQAVEHFIAKFQLQLTGELPNLDCL